MSSLIPPPAPDDDEMPRPGREATRGDPEELGNEQGWDGAPIASARPHYPYDAILRYDLWIRVLSAVSLSPVLCTLVLVIANWFRHSAYCAEVLCPLLMLLPFLGRMYPNTAGRILTAASYGLFLWIGLLFLYEGIRYRTFALPYGLCLTLAGILGPAAWLGVLWHKKRLSELHLPNDLPPLVGSLTQPTATRAWVALQREADLAAQSIGWDEKGGPAAADAPGADWHKPV